VAFNVPHHPHHSGEAHVRGRDVKERRPQVFPSLPLSFYKPMMAIATKKKTRKYGYLFVKFN
jgi:hypothetical protein